MRLAISGIRNAIAFEGCDEIAGMLSAALCGWHVEPVDSQDPPSMTVRKTDAGYERHAAWLESSHHFADPVDATCDLIADIIRRYTDENGILCLHAAAVDFAGGLVVFPDPHRRGKSTLSGLLAQGGYPLFSDDVLPIEKGGLKGEAIGILPRVRLPLPDGLPAAFRAFVDETARLRNHRYCYFGRIGETAALKGTTAPIRAIVMLERGKNDTEKASLKPATASDTLARLIHQNFAQTVPAPEVLNQLHDIVMGAECFTLHYSEGDDAAALLERRFGNG